MSLEVSFDNNKTYSPLSATDFANSNYTIEFGTLTNNKFTAFASSDISNTQA
ncbi:hypothetical protein J6W20_01625 [bacterium]|nr:hypothetical protein [bacterium]